MSSVSLVLSDKGEPLLIRDMTHESQCSLKFVPPAALKAEKFKFLFYCHDGLVGAASQTHDNQQNVINDEVRMNSSKRRRIGSLQLILLESPQIHP